MLIVPVSMLAITGIVAWVAARGKDAVFKFVGRTFGVEMSVELNITTSSKAEDIRRELAEQGLPVER